MHTWQSTKSTVSKKAGFQFLFLSIIFEVSWHNFTCHNNVCHKIYRIRFFNATLSFNINAEEYTVLEINFLYGKWQLWIPVLCCFIPKNCARSGCETRNSNCFVYVTSWVPPLPHFGIQASYKHVCVCACVKYLSISGLKDSHVVSNWSTYIKRMDWVQKWMKRTFKCYQR